MAVKRLRSHHLPALHALMLGVGFLLLALGGGRFADAQSCTGSQGSSTLDGSYCQSGACGGRCYSSPNCSGPDGILECPGNCVRCEVPNRACSGTLPDDRGCRPFTSTCQGASQEDLRIGWRCPSTPSACFARCFAFQSDCNQACGGSCTLCAGATPICRPGAGSCLEESGGTCQGALQGDTQGSWRCQATPSVCFGQCFTSQATCGSACGGAANCEQCTGGTPVCRPGAAACQSSGGGPGPTGGGPGPVRPPQISGPTYSSGPLVSRVGSWILNLGILRPLNFGSLLDLLDRVFSVLLFFAIPLAVIIFGFAGIMFLSSAGDEQRVTRAKAILFWGIVGLATVLLARGILYTIIRFFVR